LTARARSPYALHGSPSGRTSPCAPCRTRHKRRRAARTRERSQSSPSGLAASARARLGAGGLLGAAIRPEARSGVPARGLKSRGRQAPGRQAPGSRASARPGAGGRWGATGSRQLNPAPTAPRRRRGGRGHTGAAELRRRPRPSETSGTCSHRGRRVSHVCGCKVYLRRWLCHALAR
jgi:hypothetical protein